MARRSRRPGPNDIPLFSTPDPTAGKVPKTPRVTPKTAVSRATDYGSSRTAKDEASRRQTIFTEMAIEEAENGNDSFLLPYQPTPSINPPRPRTLAAGYDPETETLRVRFRDGVGYEYYQVPRRVWNNFKRVKSPGRAINRTLNNYSYSRADW